MKSYEERMRDERDEAIADLERQVAALTKERDELETECAAHAACTKYRVEQLAAVVQQRDELLAALAFYANPNVYEPDSIGRRDDITFVAKTAIAKVQL